MKSINNMMGIFLIIVGIFVGMAILDVIPIISVLFILPVAFLVPYYTVKKHIILLVPGCLSAAIATYITLRVRLNDFDGISILLLLGAAFFAIFFIHNLKMDGSHLIEKYWPIIPGASLLILGGLLMAGGIDFISFNAAYLSLFTPLALIVTGAIIILYGNKRRISITQHGEGKGGKI